MARARAYHKNRCINKADLAIKDNNAERKCSLLQFIQNHLKIPKEPFEKQNICQHATIIT